MTKTQVFIFGNAQVPLIQHARVVSAFFFVGRKKTRGSRSLVALLERHRLFLASHDTYYVYTFLDFDDRKGRTSTYRSRHLTAHTFTFTSAKFTSCDAAFSSSIGLFWWHKNSNTALSPSPGTRAVRTTDYGVWLWVVRSRPLVPRTGPPVFLKVLRRLSKAPNAERSRAGDLLLLAHATIMIVRYSEDMSLCVCVCVCTIQTPELLLAYNGKEVGTLSSTEPINKTTANTCSKKNKILSSNSPAFFFSFTSGLHMGMLLLICRVSAALRSMKTSVSFRISLFLSNYFVT